MIASTELQKAIYKALTDTSSYGVYEIPPTKGKFPYITIGEELLTTDNTKTTKRTSHNITIHTWSKRSESTESKILNDFVVNTLLNDFKVNGFYLDKSSLEIHRTLIETETQDKNVFHGVLMFNFILTNGGNKQ